MNYKQSLFLIAFILWSTVSVSGQTEMLLYPDKVPGNINKAIDVSNEDRSVFRRVSTPTLRVYLGEKRDTLKTVVIICPGGGYGELNIKREGYDIAEAFEKAGIAAVVLKYRLPDDKTNLKKSIAPLQDAQQAIKVVRDSAKAWNVDPDKLGIMGFSAGGHLASSAGVHFRDVLIPNTSRTPLKPNFMILVYPVISFGNRYGHIGSRNNLLGKKPPADSVNYFSNELFVTRETPQTFLIHSGDDNIVSVLNSSSFYEALHRQRVPADLHVYGKGGHGFGTTPSFEEWFGRCLNWLRTSNLIK